MHGLSQDLDPESEIDNCKCFRHTIFKVGPQYTQISTINMNKLIEIRHDIFIQCQENYMMMEIPLYA